MNCWRQQRWSTVLCRCFPPPKGSQVSTVEWFCHDCGLFVVFSQSVAFLIGWSTCRSHTCISLVTFFLTFASLRYSWSLHYSKLHLQLPPSLLQLSHRTNFPVSKKKSHLALTWTSTVTSAYLCCSSDLSNLNKILVTLPLPVVYGFGSKKKTWQTLIITLFVRGRQMGQWWRYSWATQTDIFKEKNSFWSCFWQKKNAYSWQDDRRTWQKKTKYFKPKHDLFLTLTQSAFSA